MIFVKYTVRNFLKREERVVDLFCGMVTAATKQGMMVPKHGLCIGCEASGRCLGKSQLRLMKTVARLVPTS